MTKPTTTLQEFNADPGRRRQLAVAIGQAAESQYLYLVGRGHKRVGTDMAKAIERESERIWRRVPKETLRPDVWEGEFDNNNARANNGRLKKQ